MRQAKEDHTKVRTLRGRGRRAPHWVRKMADMGLGTRGVCVGCDNWGTLHDGLCEGCRNGNETQVQ